MALDAATFITEYPEFAEANTTAPALIARVLRQAAGFVDAGVWGDRYQDGLFCKAAELLAMTPFGETARLKGDSRSSGYSVIFEQMIAALPIRIMVSGGIPSSLPPIWWDDCDV